MSAIFRYLIVAALITTAFGLAVCFVEYRVQKVVGGGAESPDFVYPSTGRIIPLGLINLAPEKGSDLAQYHGKISAEKGIYAKREYPFFVALLFGILAPMMLVAVAAFLLFRKIK